MGRCRPRISLAEFEDITEFHGAPVLMDYSKTTGLVSSNSYWDVIESLELKRIHPPEFIYIRDWGTEYICLKEDPGTCYRLDKIRDLCIDMSEVYAAKDKPLVARIEGTNWYAIIAHTSLK